MYKYCVIVLGLHVPMMFCMEPKGMQLDFPASTRKAYIQQNIVQQPTQPICNFCDEKVLSANYIIREDRENDVREMMNKFPYFDFDQGQHLLIMPISHKEHPDEFSQKEIIEQADAVRNLSAKLYYDAYSQEYFTNWGRIAGQSVPHWHTQFKSYSNPPLSVPERVECCKNPRIKNIEDAYTDLKIILELANNIQPSLELAPDENKCVCCLVKNDHVNDEKNLVVGRFKHNYVCLSHYPSLPGEISVVPNRHVAVMKDLSREEWGENMILAMALLPKMKAYAHEYIRECGGANLCTKSMGVKASSDEKRKFHIHTVLLPRTIVPVIPGKYCDSSCKLDFDPIHLFTHLKSIIQEIKGL